jgi:hypothetical protein
MIFATVFNISSDVMLLCIPIPIVVRSRIPLKRCASVLCRQESAADMVAVVGRLFCAACWGLDASM